MIQWRRQLLEAIVSLWVVVVDRNAREREEKGRWINFNQHHKTGINKKELGHNRDLSVEPKLSKECDLNCTLFGKVVVVVTKAK